MRFHKYRMQEEHQAALEAAMEAAAESPGDLSWHWVTRHNPAMRFPTDFALLRVSPERSAVLKVSCTAVHLLIR